MELYRDYLASRVVAEGKELDNYSKVYFKTNEDLVTNFRKVNFDQKRVLSVLASSDQLFMARYKGAKRVDCFDQNVLTLYYYYLRIWTIQYTGLDYPEPILENDYQWLNDLLCSVHPTSKEENDALLFWKKHVEKETKLSNLFFDDFDEGKTLFRTTNSVKSTIPKKLKFQKLNFFSDIDCSSTYDIVLLSNIIEWARDNDGIIVQVRDNLNRILDNNGLVLCTRLIHHYPQEIAKERRIFEENFSYHELGSKGYVYCKK